MNRYYPKRVNPRPMITHLREIVKPIGLKKPSFRNLLLIILAVCTAKTFRINEIASRLPLEVKTEKSKQKRLLRFLDTQLPLDCLQKAWLAFVIQWLRRLKTYRHFLVLVDETDLVGGWKAIVAAVAFRHRAIPVFWHIYKDEEIQSGKYKSHNEIIQEFCLTLYRFAVRCAPQVGEMPILVFDRGFARAKYVIKFLKDQEIPFIMRVCRNVGIRYQGSLKKLDDLRNKFHGEVLYHATLQIPVELYVRRNNPKDPMYLISNHASGHHLYHCYKRRMQIEHGFRDIKTRFGFGELVLKKPTHQRVAVLWGLACLAYGVLFLSYEKSATRWAKAFNGNSQKRCSVITVIKRVISDIWHPGYLLSFFTEMRCRGDTLFGVY